MTEGKESPKTSWQRLMVVLGIILIAASMRAPITSVGPVINQITEELKLTPVLVGLITTIPLISFAVLSVFAPLAAKKTGLEKLLLYSLLILAIGSLTRSWGNVFFLFLGAALIGAAITIGNVLLPAYIKKEFPLQVGPVTGAYLVSMNLTSALAAGFSIQIGQLSGLGWQGAIGVWGIFAILAFIVWLPQTTNQTAAPTPDRAIKAGSLRKSRLAWQISIFMGLQSLLFYTLAAWLPAVLQSWGMSNDRSGWMLSYIQMAQLPVMLTAPVIAGKMKDQRPMVWTTFLVLAAGLGGVFFGKTQYIIISVILMGIGLGLAFPLVTMFFVLRTRSTAEAAKLSGMAQSVGYLLAALGPPVFGGLYSFTGHWDIPLILLMVVTVCLLVVGLGSAKNRYVPQG